MTTPYTLHSKISSDALFETWRGKDAYGESALIRFAPDVKNGDILIGDGDTIGTIVTNLKNKAHANYFPTHLSWDDEKAYCTYPMDSTALSLAEVKKAFDGDLNLADSAWMINRLLETLHLVNTAGYVHCSIVPDNFFIIPATHDGKLIGFECAQELISGKIRHFINPTWSAFYPDEIPDGPITTSSDVYMASMVIGYLLPANPDDIPEALGNLLAACQLGPRARVQTIKELHDDFNKIIRGVLGPKKWRPLVIP